MYIAPGERSLKAWAWRMLIGPAQIVDGLCHFFTLGFIPTNLTMPVVCKWTLSKFEVQIKKPRDPWPKWKQTQEKRDESH